MSDEHWDQFEDLRDPGGIFSSSMAGEKGGLREFDSVKDQVTGDGVVIEMMCRGCGRSKQVLITWPEVVALRCGMSPSIPYRQHPQLHEYGYVWRPAHEQPGYWVPDGSHCDGCGLPVQPLVTTAECTKALIRAKQQGALNAEQEQQLGAICMAMRGGR